MAIEAKMDRLHLPIRRDYHHREFIESDILIVEWAATRLSAPCPH